MPLVPIPQYQVVKDATPYRKVRSLNGEIRFYLHGGMDFRMKVYIDPFVEERAVLPSVVGTGITPNCWELV